MIGSMERTRTGMSWLVMLGCLVGACGVATGSRGQADLGQIASKHTFRATFRPREAGFRQCQQADVSGYTPQALAAQGYLERVFAEITARNPETFSPGGEYDPANFCLVVKQSTAVNALSEPRTGEIQFFSGFFKGVDADAETALILAHELAHVTLQHLTQDSPALLLDPQFQALKKSLTDTTRKMKDMIAKVQAARTALGRELAGLWGTRSELALSPQSLGDVQMLESTSSVLGWNDANCALWLSVVEDSAANQQNQGTKLVVRYEKRYGEKIFPLEQSRDKLRLEIAGIEREEELVAERILGSRYALYNWREEEADDVAFELSLRAGFDPLASSVFFLKVMRDPALKSACEALLLVGGPAPDRGRGGHPSECFRMFNLRILEREEHEIDYAPFLQGELRRNLPFGGIDSIRDQL